MPEERGCAGRHGFIGTVANAAAIRSATALQPKRSRPARTTRMPRQRAPSPAREPTRTECDGGQITVRRVSDQADDCSFSRNCRAHASVEMEPKPAVSSLDMTVENFRAIQARFSISRTARSSPHRDAPVKPRCAVRHSKHALQNLWPLNSRWLWFVQYFAKCRGAGFSTNTPRALTAESGWQRRYQDASNARMRLATIRNLSGFPWFWIQTHGRYGL